MKLLEISSIALLIVFTFIFFSKILCSGDPLFGSDFILYFNPLKRFIRDYFISNGSFPLWNPYLFSGSPVISNIQASMFYPLGFLYYLLPPEQAYGYSTILHCILGSAFMYCFMRSLSISFAGSFLSAFIFTFNGIFMGHLYAGHLSFVQSYIWIPLIFLFLYRFVVWSHISDAVITGLIFGIQILGGFPQITFYTIFGALAFCFFYGIIIAKKRGFKAVLRIGIGLAIMIMTGLFLASVQLLPTLEFMSLSTRAGGINYDFATFGSLHPKELLTFIFPDIFGNVVDKTYWGSSFGGLFWEDIGYLGILPLFMVFFSKRDDSLRHLRYFFILLTFFSLLLALGKHNPVYPIIYRLPGFNSFRLPAQILFLYMFGMAVMCGMGFDRWLEGGFFLTKGFVTFFILAGVLIISSLISLHYFHRQFFLFLFQNFAETPLGNIDFDKLYMRIGLGVDRAGILFFASALLLLLRKHNKIKDVLFGAIVIAIVVIDLGLFGVQFIEPFKLEVSESKEQIRKALNREPAKGRVVTMSPLFRPNDGLEYRFPSILGYDPLILKRYAHYVQVSQDQYPENHVVNLSWIKRPDSKLIKMLNARQFVAKKGIEIIDNEIPYFIIVNNIIIKDPDDVLSFLKSDQFDPKETVVFESPESASLYRRDSEPPVGACTITAYKNEEIHLRVVTDKPGYLVLSEVFYPGWQAVVDGERRPIQRGNYLFRVIYLEEGEHDVNLYFVSWPFRIGAALSIITLMFSVFFIFYYRKRAAKIRKQEVL
ncbi:YfhO family protein [Thermodesulfobacteriota bacterium]